MTNYFFHHITTEYSSASIFTDKQQRGILEPGYYIVL